MTRLQEYDFVEPYMQEDSSTNSRLWRVSYFLRESPLPRNFRRTVIDTIQGMPKLPIPEPVNVKVGGVPIRFKIETQVDWERLANPLYEGEFANIIMNSLREVGSNGVFWDIGAAQGLYAVPAVNVVGRVVAFEPEAETHQSLLRNMELNDISGKATCLKIALGDSDGLISLFSEGKHGDSPSVKKVNKNKRSTMVESHRIDTLIDSGAVPSPEVVKIDIEGHELSVLKGGEKLFTSDKKPKYLLMEIHPVYLSQFYNSSFKEIWNIITETYGYTPQLVMSHHPNRFMCYFKSI